jgi:prevent-host-death family protein
MKIASVSTAKNRLSALLQEVRRGKTVVITDRGVPVARLEPVAAGDVAAGGALESLVRSGLVAPARKPPGRRGRRKVAGRPRLPAGVSVADVVVAEREQGW